MRGKVRGERVMVIVIGITPACAGKRYNARIVPTVAEDHPRVCGEKSIRMLDPIFTLGSPPRVRGKVALMSFRNP